MSDNRQRNFILYSQVFAGMGIGILMGLIIGLSVSPVVKSILGTLSGLLGVFLGLQDGIFRKKAETPNSLSPVILSSLRAGSFGIFCVLAILLGLYLRVNDVIGMSVENQVKRWTDAGYDPLIARELAMYEKLNMTSMKLMTLHEQKTTVVRTDSTKEVIEHQTVDTGGLAGTFLFSHKSLPKLSHILDPATYVEGELNESNVSNVLANYKRFNTQLENYAFAVQDEISSPQDQVTVVLSLTSLSISLYGSKKDYQSLKKAMSSFNELQQWEGSSRYPEISSIVDVVNRNLDPSLKDPFVKIIADVLYNVDFEDE